MALGFTNKGADHDPFARVTNPHGIELMGKSPDATYWRIPATHDAGDFPFECCPPCRTGKNYQFRTNYEGWYWVASTKQSVWFESLTEKSVLTQMDHEGGLVSVASQPFAIVASGYRHYLDFAALYNDGTRVAIDVRPADRIDDATAKKFAFAGQVAREIGIGYEVRNGPTGWLATNLEWLSHFRQPRYALDSASHSRLLNAAAQGASLATLAACSMPHNEPRARAGIFHAMWKRELVAVTDGPISNHTEITARVAT